MNERSAEGDWREPVPPRLDAPVAATLSEEAFAEHLRRALRTLGDPLLLAQSPLVHAAFVQAAAPPGASPPERAACLRRLLHDEIETIRTLGGDNGWYRVLHAAYVRPGTSSPPSGSAIRGRVRRRRDRRPAPHRLDGRSGRNGAHAKNAHSKLSNVRAAPPMVTRKLLS